MARSEEDGAFHERAVECCCRRRCRRRGRQGRWCARAVRAPSRCGRAGGACVGVDARPAVGLSRAGDVMAAGGAGRLGKSNEAATTRAHCRSKERGPEGSRSVFAHETGSEEADGGRASTPTQAPPARPHLLGARTARAHQRPCRPRLRHLRRQQHSTARSWKAPSSSLLAISASARRRRPTRCGARFPLSARRADASPTPPATNASSAFSRGCSPAPSPCPGCFSAGTEARPDERATCSRAHDRSGASMSSSSTSLRRRVVLVVLAVLLLGRGRGGVFLVATHAPAPARLAALRGIRRGLPDRHGGGRCRRGQERRKVSRSGREPRPARAGRLGQSRPVAHAQQPRQRGEKRSRKGGTPRPRQRPHRAAARPARGDARQTGRGGKVLPQGHRG